MKIKNYIFLIKIQSFYKCNKLFLFQNEVILYRVGDSFIEIEIRRTIKGEQQLKKRELVLQLDLNFKINIKNRCYFNIG